MVALDNRLVGACAYCGGEGTTADHVPSRALLDEPYPDNLMVVSACRPCNSGHSLDEEYLACFIECVVSGSAEPGGVGRLKIRRSLAQNPRLAAQLAASRIGTEPMIWKPEMERVRNVMVKLARGHTAYEFNEPQTDEPESVGFMPLPAMSNEQLEAFEDVSGSGFAGWPEIGSRAFMSLVEGHPESAFGRWMTVQPGRYRYSVPDQFAVRMVLSEYLACEVRWG